MPFYLYLLLSLVFLTGLATIVRNQKNKHLLVDITAIFLFIKYWTVPPLKLISTSIPEPLYQPKFGSTDIFTSPLLESLRALVYRYFIHLSPDFLFTLIYPVAIIFVFFGIYYFANNEHKRLNQLWFIFLVLAPLVGGMPLIFPLSLLSAAGVTFLLTQKSWVFKLIFLSLFLVLAFQIAQAIDLHFIHKL